MHVKFVTRYLSRISCVICEIAFYLMKDFLCDVTTLAEYRKAVPERKHLRSAEWSVAILGFEIWETSSCFDGHICIFHCVLALETNRGFRLQLT